MHFRYLAPHETRDCKELRVRFAFHIDFKYFCLFSYIYALRLYWYHTLDATLINIFYILVLVVFFCSSEDHSFFTHIYDTLGFLFCAQELEACFWIK